MISAFLGILALVLTIPLWLVVFSGIKKLTSFMLSPASTIKKLELPFTSKSIKPFTYFWAMGALITIIFLIYGLTYKSIQIKSAKISDKARTKVEKNEFKKAMESYRKHKRKYKNANPISPSPLIQF